MLLTITEEVPPGMQSQQDLQGSESKYARPLICASAFGVLHEGDRRGDPRSRPLLTARRAGMTSLPHPRWYVWKPLASEMLPTIAEKCPASGYDSATGKSSSGYATFKAISC